MWQHHFDLSQSPQQQHIYVNSANIQQLLTLNKDLNSHVDNSGALSKNNVSSLFKSTDNHVYSNLSYEQVRNSVLREIERRNQDQALLPSKQLSCNQSLQSIQQQSSQKQLKESLNTVANSFDSKGHELSQPIPHSSNASVNNLLSNALFGSQINRITEVKPGDEFSSTNEQTLNTSNTRQLPLPLPPLSPRANECIVPANPYLTEEIPQWLYIYSKAPPEHDHKLKVIIKLQFRMYLNNFK